MLPSDRQVYSDSDESLDNFPRKKTKISHVNEQSFDRDILIDKGSQNCDDIEMDHYFNHKNQNLENNQNVSSGVSDDDDYNVNNFEDSESEDYVPMSGGKHELEKYVTNETNSKTNATDGDFIKDVSVFVNDISVFVNDFNNDKERMTKSYKHIGIDDDELYEILEKPYRDKNKYHNKHKKKVATPDENTDSESEDYVPMSGGEHELEKYVTNETNSKTDATDGEFIKDVSVFVNDISVFVNDFNNDKERMTKSYKHIGIDDDELYEILEKPYRDKNKYHNKHKKKVATPDENTDSESEDYVPMSGGEHELEKYVTNETNSKTDATDGEFIKDVSVFVNDFNNDEERMTKSYKHIGIDDDELYELLEKPYRDKNKYHNKNKNKVVTPDENTDSDSGPMSGGEFELEEYVTNETNSKTDATDGEFIKDVSVLVNDFNNDEERMTKSYKHITIDDDELYELLEKPYRDKNKYHKKHKKKVVTPDENTDSDSEDYVPMSGSEFELEEYVTNETNSKTDETDHESIKNKPHNESNKEVFTPDDYEEGEKTLLEEVCKNHFDILPENWIHAIHNSGMPIYLNKKSRVVTLSRPYFLGPGDPKSHLAPVSAITCLQYQKGLENKEIIKNVPNYHVSKVGDMIIPNAKVETVEENIIKESLTHVELREYCQSLFKLKVEENKSPNKTPKEQNIKTEISGATLKNTKERPSLPDSTKLISFPLQTEDHNKQFYRRREWIMNPIGKSYVSILHEYLQQALQTLPRYEFKELESEELPYSATVVLNDVQYGVGLGINKKQAKLNAAQATLDILIPEMKNKIDSNIKNQSDPVIFDQIKVTDPRVIEFCAKTSEPSPYDMLLICLQRNIGECEIGIEFKVNKRHRTMFNQYCTMTVGKDKASVPCKNKRDGKQKAAQIILSLLHPHIDNWGSLLRLYGNGSIKNPKEKKQEQQEITRLQCKATANQPNFAILNKLKEEMLKIRDQRKLKETNEMLGLPSTMLATTCPNTIAIPSSSTSPN